MAMAYKMATEGMNVKEECQRWFMEMKWKKVHRFVAYKIDERSRAVLVDKVGGPGEGYEELVAALPTDDCRYAVFDFDFVTVDNCQKSKIFFIAWYVRTYVRIPEPLAFSFPSNGLAVQSVQHPNVTKAGKLLLAAIIPAAFIKVAGYFIRSDLA